MNPPYGIRMEERGELRDLYKGIGNVLKQNFIGFEAWVISPNFDTAKFIGLRPSKKIALYNGPIETRFLKFEVYEGTKRYGDNPSDRPADSRKRDVRKKIILKVLRLLAGVRIRIEEVMILVEGVMIRIEKVTILVEVVMIHKIQEVLNRKISSEIMQGKMMMTQILETEEGLMRSDAKILTDIWSLFGGLQKQTVKNLIQRSQVEKELQ